MNIGTKIKNLREDKHLSQSELAFELGVSQGTLHNIESGNSKKVDFLLMDKVCQFFDKDFEYFLETKIVNNITENNGQVSCEDFTINNNFPDNFLEEFKKLVEQNQANEKIIEDLKEKLNTND
ncbi:transcriptional regulator with XRE-family HTH domain [Chryseobacterium ginsenosidimutans]|uniref:helix-turn-helix domain-containing protein n=1 Tax=Chryseobacterium ginsenosidimutans TaxID=687846 RepID=UPI002780A22E|nr:helix-turn-helix transcriptional regulator [Chryseobacterium ginsenosidimutans]MDQ0594460.1 transcriptional regulator with XRE-family HTH domain [Chryseobacterium ginsenosidimutans]